MNKRTSLCMALVGVVLAGALVVLALPSKSVRAEPVFQEVDAPLLVAIKTAEGDGGVAPGESIRFHIAVTNTGSVTATNVVVRDNYDAAVFPTIDDAGGGQNDGVSITWQVGDLIPGEGWAVSYSATAAETIEPGVTDVSNVAVVQADNVDTGVETSVALVVQVPELTLSRKRDPEGEIQPGGTVRYTIRYSNAGTADAANVVLEEEYNGSIVEELTDISGEGFLEDSKIRWDLGTLNAGSSGEVSYSVRLKLALTGGVGDVEARNVAVISANGVEPVTAEDTFTFKLPLLSISRERHDLSGGAIEPGDTLLFVIRVENSGGAAASDVTVCDDYDEQVVAAVSNVSPGGNETEGAVEWPLTEALEPGEIQSFSYKVRLISEIGGATSVINKAKISIQDLELTSSETTMTIEPVIVAPTPESTQVFAREPVTTAWLIGVSTVVALLVVIGLGLIVLGKGQWQERYFRFIIEGVVVVVIVQAVLVLAMNKSIESDGAVTILSGTAGYLLGRSLGDIGKSQDDGSKDS